jgi:molybdopterin-guanine dinucleotide biosynthesis protein A
MNVDVILPAGGRISGEFAREAGAEIKALMTLDGKTVIEHTLETLRRMECVERVIVIGPRELADHPACRLADAVLPEGASGPDNLFCGLEWLERTGEGHPGERALILATDLPFLTEKALEEYLRRCPPDSDICIPIIRREAFEARFPGSQNTYLKLRDGEWTMGCAFLVHPAAIAANRAHLESVFAARKSQIGMARLLGFSFILKFLMRRLSIPDIEARCRQILGCSGTAIPHVPAELAFDIDRPSDYRYAYRHFKTEKRTLA